MNIQYHHVAIGLHECLLQNDFAMLRMHVFCKSGDAKINKWGK